MNNSRESSKDIFLEMVEDHKKDLKNNRNKRLEDALDFVQSSLNDLSEEKYRYAILHLFTGISLALKIVLEKESWCLLFQNIDDVNAGNFFHGDFKGVSFDSSIKRIKGIQPDLIKEGDEKFLKSLKLLRNKVQHFHLKEKDEKIKSIMFGAFSFFIDFIRKRDFKGEDEIERTEIHDELISEIVENLRQLEEFVEKRMEDIADSEKFKKAKVVMTCGECLQKANIPYSDDFSQTECLFCNVIVDNKTAHINYLYLDKGYKTDEVLFYNLECDQCYLDHIVLGKDKKYFCLDCRGIVEISN